MGAHGGRMPGTRRGGMGTRRGVWAPAGGVWAPAGGGWTPAGGVWAPAGGVWAPAGGGMVTLKHFCSEGGSPKKPLIIKKIHHIESKVAERPSHGEKGPCKGKTYQKKPYHNKKGPHKGKNVPKKAPPPFEEKNVTERPTHREKSSKKHGEKGHLNPIRSGLF